VIATTGELSFKPKLENLVSKEGGIEVKPQDSKQTEEEEEIVEEEILSEEEVDPDEAYKVKMIVPVSYDGGMDIKLINHVRKISTTEKERKGQD
jgi:hypothetical protein